jgi:DNA-directed RNA polymerase specialized sigma24 family protein
MNGTGRDENMSSADHGANYDRENGDFADQVQAARRNRELIAELTRWRNSHGPSQAEVAKRMRTSQSAVARLESHQHDAQLSTLGRYVAALGLSLDFVVSDRETTAQIWSSREQDQTKEAIDRAGASPAAREPDSGEGALYAEHAGALLQYLLRLTNGDRLRAEDIVQETMLLAWRHPEAIAGKPARPWLFEVALNLAIAAIQADRQAWRSMEHGHAGDAIGDAPGGLGRASGRETPVPGSVKGQVSRREPTSGESLVRTLYAEHAGPLLRYALHLTGGDRQRAEDIVQETMWLAWQHPEAIAERPARPWLFAVARNLAVEQVRRARPHDVGKGTPPPRPSAEHG